MAAEASLQWNEEGIEVQKQRQCDLVMKGCEGKIRRNGTVGIKEEILFAFRIRKTETW